MLHTQDRTTVQYLTPAGMRAVALWPKDWARLLQVSDLGFQEERLEQDDRILDALRRALR